MRELQPVELAYLAGLIDGEGYIGVTATNTSKSAKGCKRGLSYRCNISVRMCERAAVQWAWEATCVGQIAPTKGSTPRARPGWQWNVWSSEAKDLATAILPFLRIKVEQARNLIEFQSIMRLPGVAGLTDDEWEARAKYRRISRDLNARGVIDVRT